MPNKVGKNGKQNRNAGTHPSYEKRKMTRAQIRAKRAYDKKFNKETIKERSGRNAARRYLGLKVGDTRDAAHTSSGVVAKDRSENRGSTSDMPGDRRARGRKRKKNNGNMGLPKY